MLRAILKRLLGGSARRDAAQGGGHATTPPTIDASWIRHALELRGKGQHAKVAALCREIVARRPGDVDAVRFLAAALFAQGEVREGLTWLRRATELSAEPGEDHRRLASALAASGDVEGAVESYGRAVALQPALTGAWHDLVQLLKAYARYDEAEAYCRAGLAANVGDPTLRQALGDVLFEQGRVEEAIAELRAAVALAPDDPRVGSDLLRMLSYSDRLGAADVLAEHRAWTQRHTQHLQAAAPPLRNTRDPERRLKIGYVSPWFRMHAVTFFLEPAIEHCDRARFEIYLYADVADPDEYSRRLQSYGTVWRRTVGTDDEALARMIRDDGIDILVDLTGHTRLNRLLVFARRAAPVQVNWLGFPATTGLPSMDYHITDRYCDPPGTTEHLYSEKLARMGGIYMAWRPPEGAPDPGPLPALRNGYVTFGSFGSCYKITPTLVALWARILQAVPRSRLMLLAFDGEVARERLRDLMSEEGVDPARLDFIPRVRFDEYLALHLRADIALDSFPYHGATTTCACLWMGLPVVVLAGEVHASRADVSMLSHAGLPQFVAATPDGYVDIAVRAAENLGELQVLRSSLRDMMRRSPNTDARACARNLETLFREMWTTWCGLSPAAEDPPSQPS